MINVYLDDNIEVNKYQTLLKFINGRSDRISVARYYQGFINEVEFNRMQNYYEDYIQKEDKKRREQYNNNPEYKKKLMAWLKTEREIVNYFDELLKQDLEAFNCVKYDDFKGKKENRFTTSSSEFIKSEFTRVTPVTQNPVFEMSYFKIGEIYNNIVCNMKELFDYPYKINGVEFEDLTFYKEDINILSICSHERFAHIKLDEDAFEQFKKLEIEYHI